MKIENTSTPAMPIAQVGFPNNQIFEASVLERQHLANLWPERFYPKQYHQDAGIPKCLCKDHFNTRSGRPKGCNRLEDDAFYPPEMMDSIPAISEPADYYHEQLRNIGYIGNFVSGLQIGQNICQPNHGTSTYNCQQQLNSTTSTHSLLSKPWRQQNGLLDGGFLHRARKRIPT